MNTENKNNASLLLRLPEDLKAALQKEAARSGRRITMEINTRLRNSLLQGLPASYSGGAISTAHVANDNGPAGALSDADRAMLAVFRAMPAEKQLALISLFK